MVDSRVAALFVRADSIYRELGADCWDIERDARRYAGPDPVVAHPPCERWSRLWWTARHLGKGLGDDDGCFEAAVGAVRRFGGVLEHPATSHAFKRFGLPRPPIHGQGWGEHRGEWSCSVDQGAYGHRAQKRTWLFYVGEEPPNLDFRSIHTTVWCISGPGGRTSEERKAKGITLIGRTERERTPEQFARVLLDLACRADGGRRQSAQGDLFEAMNIDGGG